MDLTRLFEKLEFKHGHRFAFFLQLQEIKKQLVRQSKEEEEMQKQLEKERENEQRAQQKYKSWLKKKNQEKMELEKKEKVRWTLNPVYCF